MEQWNSVRETVWWNSGTMLEEQWNSDSGTVWWKMEECWLNSETVMVEPWNSDSGTVWWKSFGGTVEQWLWNSGTGEQ